MKIAPKSLAQAKNFDLSVSEPDELWFEFGEASEALRPCSP